MRLDEIASIRTGVVLGRKKVEDETSSSFRYEMINLKCIGLDGTLDRRLAEVYFAREPIKSELLTQIGDVIIRLSFPYTSVLISEEKNCGFLIPSHFAIIRTDNDIVLPEYMLWFLQRKSTYQRILQNSSGSTALGTISSGFIGSLNIQALPLDKQKAIGQLLLLSNKEKELLIRLAYEKSYYNKTAINILYERFKGEK